MANQVDTSVLRGRDPNTRATVEVAGGTRPLTVDEARYGVIEFTGALAATQTVEFPAVDGHGWQVVNGTTGDFALVCKVAGQPGIRVPQGRRLALTCDGTDLRVTDNVRGSRAPAVNIVVSGATVTLTTAQAQAQVVALTVGDQDFALVLPEFALDIGDRIFVSNQTAYHANVQLGTGDPGVDVGPGLFAVLMASPLGIIMRNMLDTDGVALYTGLQDLAIGGALAGVGRGLTRRQRNRTIAGDAVLTATDYQSGYIKLAGTLSGNATVSFPAAGAPEGAEWWVENATVGGFAVICKVQGEGGAGVTIASARRAEIHSTGAAMERLTADSAA